MCTHKLTGLSTEGLYRVSGITSEVLRIKKEFDRGKYSSVSDSNEFPPSGLEAACRVRIPTPHSRLFLSPPVLRCPGRPAGVCGHPRCDRGPQALPQGTTSTSCHV